MCGIFGVVNKPIDEDLARLCTDRLYHRGPDAGKVWQKDNVTLGHRRLAILDLSEKGVQPISYADGRYTMVLRFKIWDQLVISRSLNMILKREDKLIC